MDPASLVGAAAAGAGVMAAVARLRKSKPEAESISVDTLRNTLKALRRELDRKDEELTELRGRLQVAEASLAEITLGHLPPHLS